MFRKQTSIFHYLGGLIIAFAFLVSAPLAISLLVSFGWLEYRQGRKTGDTWIMDCLECVQGVFVGAGILIILNCLWHSLFLTLVAF